MYYQNEWAHLPEETAHPFFSWYLLYVLQTLVFDHEALHSGRHTQPHACLLGAWWFSSSPPHPSLPDQHILLITSTNLSFTCRIEHTCGNVLLQAHKIALAVRHKDTPTFVTIWNPIIRCLNKCSIFSIWSHGLRGSTDCISWWYLMLLYNHRNFGQFTT